MSTPKLDESGTPQDVLDKFQVLKDVSPYSVRFSQIDSAQHIPDGSWVMYALELEDKFFQLTQVTKTDARGIVKTTSGISFTSRGDRYYHSTQKLDGKRYAALHCIDKAFEQYQKNLHKAAASDRENNHHELKRKIERLNPHDDAELVQKLRDILGKEKS